MRGDARRCAEMRGDTWRCVEMRVGAWRCVEMANHEDQRGVALGAAHGGCGFEEQNEHNPTGGGARQSTEQRTTGKETTVSSVAVGRRVRVGAGAATFEPVVVA